MKYVLGITNVITFSSLLISGHTYVKWQGKVQQPEAENTNEVWIHGMVVFVQLLNH